MKQFLLGAVCVSALAAVIAYAADTRAPYMLSPPFVSGHMVTATSDGLGIQDGGVAPTGGTGGTNTWTGTNTFNANVFPPSPAAVTATGNLDPTATAMCGGTINYNGAAAGTLSILNTWPVGCNVSVVAVSTFLATIAAGTGTMHTACTTARTRAQFSIIWIRSEGAVGVVDVGGDCG
jgi:hypothetical protein